ncbi:MAG: RHS repeat-associated core domain-containing protein, partial [Bacillota bacterium]|nr:RHS repeat-associated core domain-containing protein [Bacillota bacterium]
VFTYDQAGNRTARTKGKIKAEYSYDKRNRLIEKIEGADQTIYQYDPHGNLIQESSRRGVTKYTYDCFNRTASVQSVNGGFIKNVYDPEGLRFEVQENGQISRFVFSGRDVVSELDGSGSLKYSTIRGHELLASKDVTGKGYYYLNNAHGDVTALISGTGDIVNSYKYDAFGNTVEAVEKVQNRFRYVGEQYDQVTGQYYLRARFYNPVVGRFTQEDTYHGDGLNLYSYVQNNPINYYDPSGYSCETKGKPIAKTEGPKVSYIFYTSSKGSDFSKQAMYRKAQLEKSGKKVIMVETNNVQAFENGWNGMGTVDGKKVSIEEVDIFSHGSERALILEDGSSTNALSIDGKNSKGDSIGDISKLNKQNIDKLYINSCNSGHLGVASTGADNLASTFKKTGTIKEVYAWDGSVGFGPGGVQSLWSDNYAPRLSNKQESFYQINKKYGIEGTKPTGQVKY